MPDTATLKTRVLEKFLRYVKYDTQSDHHSQTYPTTAKQLVLLEALTEELRAIGLADVQRDQYGYVTATIPATSKKKVPVIAFVAHVDTSPELSGANVKPIVHRAWNGEDIVLPDDRTAVLSRAEIPELEEQIGNDIVTASGTTLLGADNKAGVAEIVAAAEYLMAHPEIAHGAIRIAFTPDEEVGGGTTFFDVKAFGAFCAYTMDSGFRGQFDLETFSADAMTVTFQGSNTHPGYARGKMVNAVKVAADFLARLPRTDAPETTADREGFVHPNEIDGGVDRVTVHFIVRDFADAGLHRREAEVEKLARAAVAAWPGSAVEIKIEETYRNMREVLDRHPQIAENAREAIRRAGLEVRETAVRGGTDGSRLSHMGLPTPNLFTGQNNFHSRLEWVSAEDMEKAVETIVHLVRVWEERA